MHCPCDGHLWGEKQRCTPEVRFDVWSFTAGAEGAPRQQLLRHLNSVTLRRVGPLSQQDFRSEETYRETLARRQGGHKVPAAFGIRLNAASRTHNVYAQTWMCFTRRGSPGVGPSRPGSCPPPLFAVRTQVSRGTGAGRIGRAFTTRSDCRQLAGAADWPALSAEKLGRTSGSTAHAIAQLTFTQACILAYTRWAKPQRSSVQRQMRPAGTLLHRRTIACIFRDTRRSHAWDDAASFRTACMR